MKPRAFILPILLVFVSNIVFAATIEGSIYDIELNELNKVVVEINTTPEQSFVSKDGKYSFDVSFGKYLITVRHEQGVAEERITVNDEGTYTIDLILFPDLREAVELLDESDLSVETFEEAPEKNYSWLYAVGFLLAIAVVLGIVLHYKKKLEKSFKDEIKELHSTKQDNLEKDLKELIVFIRKEGGRTTQKDIRKQFPQSEAKISLMISELEHKGKIKKIKKGRGNIITLT